jgi:hypothetical protein
MNAHTDSRLLDTAVAIESIGVMRKDARSVAPTVAPTTVRSGQNLSFSDNWAESSPKAKTLQIRMIYRVIQGAQDWI